MPSETIWSNNSGSPIQVNSSNASNSGSHHQYRSVLDQVDPEVAKLLGNNSGQLSSERRFSFNDGSDIDGNLFGLKRGSLSAITAPVGGASSVNFNPNSANNNRLNFGTASISGGIASRHPPQDSFLQKFSTVADATREIELSNGLGNLSIDNGNSRRTSFNNDGGIKPLTEFGALSSPRGSLNENLNMPAPRTSRHQSISEKIDNYNNTSPIQGSAALSIASDSQQSENLNSRIHPGHHNNAPQNFWNPATAASFTPAFSYNYLGDGSAVPPHQSQQAPPQGFNPYNGRGGNSRNIPPIGPPPFIIPSPPPQFMDPSLYGMINYGVNNVGELEKSDEVSETTQDALDEDGKPKENTRNVHTPGIGMMNRQIPPASFMFHPFNPYPMYQQAPPPVGVPSISPVQGPIDSNVPVFEAPPASNPSPPQPTPPSSAGGKRKGGRNGNNSNNSNDNSGKGANHIYRSPLLEEVRSNSKGKEYYLKDIYGHAVEFTKDQHGSRFIQQKLPDASDEEKEVIFNEIRDISYDLMTDVFGNYVIQKFFEFGSNTQRKVLLDNMLGHIYELSLQMYGCRVIQRAIEEIDLEGQVSIIEELRDHILICAKDQNGNHVIQKSIERIPFDRIKFVSESLNNQIYHLSTHPYGCRVIQRLLDYSNVEDQNKILKELNRFIFYLIQDQYGNYVMQHILERGEMKDREEILKVVLGSVVNFSKHKFASNVIEKCIKFGTLDQRKRILKEVMLGNEDYNVELVNDDSPLALMMKDQYANYVIQKLVEGFDARSDEKKRLVVKLRQYLKQISSKNTYGKHLASVEKMIIVAETALIEADNK